MTGTPSKRHSLEELTGICSRLRAEGKTVVLCHGVFDVLHVGHVRYLTQAKSSGDILVVTIAPDNQLKLDMESPAFREDLRAEVLSSIGCVDYVAVARDQSAVDVIRRLRPHVYARGADYPEPHLHGMEQIVEEDLAVQAVGGRIEVTDEITSTSAQFIKKYVHGLPREASDYLNDFADRYPIERINDYLKRAGDLRVLVIGETIIDEYHYCETIGKSGKEPMLAARYVSSEKFAGGILAVANHVAALSDHVGLITSLGAIDSQEEFIREKLNPRIETAFHYQPGAPTIVKRRFAEIYPFQKLFEVYVMKGDEEDPGLTREICGRLEEMLPRFDLVIVTDYGHGMLGPEVVETLCRRSKFLAVNTQVNADNRGFNTISKYPRADYISLSENEIRMEVRSRRRDLRSIVSQVAERLSCPRIMVTRGQQGCLAYEAGQGFYEVPAFTGRIVDRVGAGDAVLSVTSLCAAQGVPMEVVSFVGNVVGSQAVAIMGNRSAIQRDALMSFIAGLRK